MPFPANWLEELIVEWLDLAGFASTTKIKVSAGPGGAFSPDVTGAKLQPEGQLLIRHCEAAMYLIQGPEPQAKKYRDKFSEKIEKAVRKHFVSIFGESLVKEAKYEKWVICCQASRSVRQRLKEEIPEIKIKMFDEFVLKDVLCSIEQFRMSPNKNTTSLPADKWLLGLIDQLKRLDLISLERGNRFP